MAKLFHLFELKLNFITIMQSPQFVSVLNAISATNSRFNDPRLDKLMLHRSLIKPYLMCRRCSFNPVALCPPIFVVVDGKREEQMWCAPCMSHHLASQCPYCYESHVATFAAPLPENSWYDESLCRECSALLCEDIVRMTQCLGCSRFDFQQDVKLEEVDGTNYYLCSQCIDNVYDGVFRCTQCHQVFGNDQLGDEDYELCQECV